MAAMRATVLSRARPQAGALLRHACQGPRLGAVAQHAERSSPRERLRLEMERPIRGSTTTTGSAQHAIPATASEAMSASAAPAGEASRSADRLVWDDAVNISDEYRKGVAAIVFALWVDRREHRSTGTPFGTSTEDCA